MKRVLVTGGLGFIGSHTVVELQQAGYEVVIVDNLSNSQAFILNRIEMITGCRPGFYQADICDKALLDGIFKNEKPFDAVIHFAALKAVGESVREPLKYFQNNLASLMNLLDGMINAGCNKLVFSSSATVYGFPDVLPVDERAPFKKALSAYGSTKQMGEEMIEKLCATGVLNAIILRYFNPVGAHSSGLIGELPLGVPNNLMPYLTQTAIGKQKELIVFGNDYDTPDGSCLRDYIHVVDLAKAHVKCCHRLIDNIAPEACEIFNVGTGNAISVLELIKQFEITNAIQLQYTIGKRRPGDAPALYADVHKANTVMQWKAEKTLTDMVGDAWRWEQRLAEEK
ncbi:NAD-dependent epimerase/dehydratase family protein [Ferruginibacter profundus]